MSGLILPGNPLMRMSMNFATVPFNFPQISAKSLRLRKGKWLPQEEVYAKLIIRDFRRGYLKRKPNSSTTLRVYLSEELRCEPMRITKKFAGDSSIGKCTYVPCSALAEDDPGLMRAQKELEEAEKKFKIMCRLLVLNKSQSRTPQNIFFIPLSSSQQKMNPDSSMTKSLRLDTSQIKTASGPISMSAKDERMHFDHIPRHGTTMPIITVPYLNTSGLLSTNSSAPRTILGMRNMPSTPSTMNKTTVTSTDDVATTKKSVFMTPVRDKSTHTPAGEGSVSRKRPLDGDAKSETQVVKEQRYIPDKKLNASESPSEAECSLLLDFITSVNSQSRNSREKVPEPSPKKPRLALQHISVAQAVVQSS